MKLCNAMLNGVQIPTQRKIHAYTLDDVTLQHKRHIATLNIFSNPSLR
jgi:very-short-patch-repair endonuclease